MNIYTPVYEFEESVCGVRTVFERPQLLMDTNMIYLRLPSPLQPPPTWDSSLVGVHTHTHTHTHTQACFVIILLFLYRLQGCKLREWGHDLSTDLTSLYSCGEQH